MSIESDSVRLAMLRAVGGQTIKSARGSFVGVFGDDYVGIGDGVADVETSGPLVTCRSSDVAALKILKGDRLTIDGDYYTVVGHRADGTGITVMQVHRA
jgi:hypothetical protein